MMRIIIIRGMQLYEIGKLIGTGSSGDVFLCRHSTDKNYNYAMKRIKTIQIEEKQRESIQNELKILQKLRHINIVSYKDSFTDKQGNLCIVMVYCQLGDMHTKIKQMKEKGKNFTEAQILDWLTQIALAIYYLHNQKILHRDLKTQNLFLKRDERLKEERIKLGDFGIAKVLDTNQDLAKTCIGTPYYMAPQIFKYHPYSYKSDIWSLGVILYQMCNLRLPFEAGHYTALARKILKQHYPSIMPTYSKQLRDLIASMLSKKPSDRPTIIDILNKPFIKTRNQKYMNEMLSRNTNGGNDMDDIYLDTLREQAIALDIVQVQQQGIKKYPSSKDLEKKSLNRSYMTKRTEEDDGDLMNQYHSKRKSTFQRESYNEKSLKRSDDTTSSFKALGIANEIYIGDEKQAFVDHKRNSMMEKLEQRKNSQFSKQSMRRFKIFQEYSMQEENTYSKLQPIQQEIIKSQGSDEQESTILDIEDEQEVPQTYNKSYYKLLHKIKVLKHRCETTLGGNKYLRVYNAVNNGATKASISEILEPHLLGYWHLIDQIMFNESILKTLPKN